MLQIFGIVSPIFALIAAGFAAVRLRLLPKEQLRGLATFVLYLAMPALIIRSLLSRPLTQSLNANYLLAYGAASAFVFCVGLFVSRVVLKKNVQTGALSALGMAASNSGFIGYPIASLVIGPVAGLGLALCMLVENILVIPAALALAETGAQAGLPLRSVASASAMRLIRNPIMIAILAGIVLAAFGATLPPPLFRVVDMLAGASAPVALFVIGGTLVGLKLSGLGPQVAQIVIGKLLLHPVAVVTALIVVTALRPGLLDPDLKSAAVIFASVPMLSIYPIFGQRYGLEDMCAAALLASTLVSIVTVSVVIWLLRGHMIFAAAG